MPPHLYERVDELMNPDPILIIKNTFPILLLAFLFSALIKSENTKKILSPFATILKTHI
jgi:hypothetical protein